jgi:hypothetical protein
LLKYENSRKLRSNRFHSLLGPFTSQYDYVYVLNCSIIQYSHLKNQSIGPEIICHLAGIARKVLLHCYNDFLDCLIILWHLLIFNFSFVVLLPFSRHCQYRLSVWWSEIEALSGQRNSLLPRLCLLLQPTFRPLRQAFPVRFDISRPLPTFAIPSSTFIDFIPSSFYFLDLSTRPVVSIHFSTMINPLRALSMHSSMFIDIAPQNLYRNDCSGFFLHWFRQNCPRVTCASQWMSSRSLGDFVERIKSVGSASPDLFLISWRRQFLQNSFKTLRDTRCPTHPLAWQ